MLNHLTFAIRNLKKRKLYTYINILGLSLGVAVTLIILRYVDFELSYDNFHEDSSSIYRVVTTRYLGEELRDRTPLTGYGIGPALKSDVPEVRGFVRTHSMLGGAVVSVQGDDNITVREEKLLFADSTFFDLFSFRFLSGNQAAPLAGPNSIVITRSVARKYFGNNDAIGKIIKVSCAWVDTDYVVTSVIEDVPANSHFDFDFILSIRSLLQQSMYAEDGGWGWQNFTTYVRLDKEGEVRRLQEKMPEFLSAYVKGKMEASFQPLRQIHISPGLAFETSPAIGLNIVYFFLLIAFFILGIAWINYINLTTARATERSREVGIKKAVGAERRQLVSQFMFESAIVNLFAVALALLIAIFLLPVLNEITGKELAFDFSDFRLWSLLTCLVFLGTLVSGSYPAFVLSRFDIISALKQKEERLTGSFTIGKALVVFQFASSLILIALTYVVFKQLQFMHDQVARQNMDHILILRGPGLAIHENREQRILTFKNQLETLAFVSDVTSSVNVPGSGYSYTTPIKRVGTGIKEAGNIVWVDPDFLDMYQSELIAGRKWNSNNTFDTKSVIINETSLRAFEFPNAEAALNARIEFDGDTFSIGGIVRDFHWNSLKTGNAPMIFRAYNGVGEYFSIRLNSDGFEAIIPKIHDVFKESFPGNPFDYFFLEDFFSNQYTGDHTFGKIFGLFASFSIFIASLGLWGVTSFTVTKRLREVGIRKVMGATSLKISILLSKDFSRLISMSVLLALPIIWYSSRSWLDSFAFRIGLTAEIFVVPVVILTLICLVTISGQIWRACRMNPSTVLRSE